jgi:hypothetical protein
MEKVIPKAGSKPGLKTAVIKDALPTRHPV